MGTVAYRAPSVAEMRAVVERRVKAVGAATGAPGDFTRIVEAAERQLVQRHKRGADLTVNYRLATNIATARAMGADGCPDPLLASLARASGVSYRTDMERVYPGRYTVAPSKPHDPAAVVRVMREQIAIMRRR